MANVKNIRYGSAIRKMGTAQTNLMTAEQLIKLPRGQYRYELLKGELLTMSPSGATHGAITIRLSGRLYNHVEAKQLGIVFGAETGFRLQRNPDTVLAPDIAFIAQGRIKSLPEGYLELPPDLAVEVISPSEREAKVEKKTALWLSLGVRAVWVVRPKTQTVEVHNVSEVRVLTREDMLQDDQIIPGFCCKVAEIFG